MQDTHYLRSALVPRSVAVIGATDRRGALGYDVFANLLAGGFKGPIYSVNPKHASVQGHPCVPSLQALPQAPDLAVVVTPARTVPALVADAGARGVPNLLVLSAGFAEVGPEGQKLQDEMLSAARQHGIRLIGPNSLGLMRPRDRPECDVRAHLGAPGQRGAGVAVRRSGRRTARHRVGGRLRVLLGRHDRRRIGRPVRRAAGFPGDGPRDPQHRTVRGGRARTAPVPVRGSSGRQHETGGRVEGRPAHDRVQCRAEPHRSAGGQRPGVGYGAAALPARSGSANTISCWWRPRRWPAGACPRDRGWRF